jgi:hypothetical protein
MLHDLHVVVARHAGSSARAAFTMPVGHPREEGGSGARPLYINRRCTPINETPIYQRTKSFISDGNELIVKVKNVHIGRR